jgi:hypothetical protein
MNTIKEYLIKLYKEDLYYSITMFWLMCFLGGIMLSLAIIGTNSNIVSLYIMYTVLSIVYASNINYYNKLLKELNDETI